MAGYHGTDWEGFIADVRQSRSKDVASEEDATLYFTGLQRLVEKKTRLFWHKDFFEQYISNKVVPWGLRIQIFPNIRKIEPKIKEAWESNLQTCSFQMMSILCQQYEQDIGQIDVEIKDLQENSGNINTYPGFTLLEKKLKDHLTKYATNLIKTKESKLQRDKRAYENGQAYRWTNINPTRNNMRKPFPHKKTQSPREIDRVDSDTSSL